jgi:hypothetical protein
VPGHLGLRHGLPGALNSATGGLDVVRDLSLPRGVSCFPLCPAFRDGTLRVHRVARIGGSLLSSASRGSGSRDTC